MLSKLFSLYTSREVIINHLFSSSIGSESDCRKKLEFSTGSSSGLGTSVEDSSTRDALTASGTASVQCGTSVTQSDDETYDESVNSSGVEVTNTASSLSVVAPTVPPSTAMLGTMSKN